jgi:hypothetical protein
MYTIVLGRSKKYRIYQFNTSQMKRSRGSVLHKTNNSLLHNLILELLSAVILYIIFLMGIIQKSKSGYLLETVCIDRL